jgi:hypothetical protein
MLRSAEQQSLLLLLLAAFFSSICATVLLLSLCVGIAGCRNAALSCAILRSSATTDQHCCYCCCRYCCCFAQGSRVVNSIANYFGRKGARAAKDGDRDIDDGVISFDDGKSLYCAAKTCLDTVIEDLSVVVLLALCSVCTVQQTVHKHTANMRVVALLAL